MAAATTSSCSTNARAPSASPPARAAAIADRRTGIGCDQFIVIEPPPPGSNADAFMRIRNPDGAEAGACGNATRCVVALLARETGRAPPGDPRPIAGNLPADVLPDGRVSVDMGPARLDWPDIPLARPMDTLHLDLALGPVRDPAAASMGNPHATFFVPTSTRCRSSDRARRWSTTRCFPSAPISASPRCWRPTASGCASGSAAPA